MFRHDGNVQDDDLMKQSCVNADGSLFSSGFSNLGVITNAVLNSTDEFHGWLIKFGLTGSARTLRQASTIQDKFNWLLDDVVGSNTDVAQYNLAFNWWWSFGGTPAGGFSFNHSLKIDWDPVEISTVDATFTNELEEMDESNGGTDSRDQGSGLFANSIAGDGDNLSANAPGVRNPYTLSPVVMNPYTNTPGSSVRFTNPFSGRSTNMIGSSPVTAGTLGRPPTTPTNQKWYSSVEDQWFCFRCGHKNFVSRLSCTRSNVNCNNTQKANHEKETLEGMRNKHKNRKNEVNLFQKGNNM
jgi:hypothetical protein